MGHSEMEQDITTGQGESDFFDYDADVDSSVDTENETDTDTDAETETSESETEETAQDQPGNEKQPYTAEEMKSLDFANIDTSRIPEEYKPFYKAMQASFTKKMQGVSEQSKELETLFETLKSTPAVVVPPQEQIRIRQQIEANFEKLTGQVYDKFEESHKKVVDTYVKSEIERVSKFQSIQAECAAKYGDKYQAVDKKAEEIINRLPVNKYMAFQSQLQAGNYEILRQVMDAAAKELDGTKNVNVTQQAPQPTQTKRTVKTPPVTEGAGAAKPKTGKDDTFALFGI